MLTFVRPIFSHGQQGVSKSGLTLREIGNHAIIYMLGTQPTLIEAEEPFREIMQDAFCVEPASGRTLHETSRLRLDMVYPVQYNLKVVNMGLIRDTAELARLEDCFARAT